MTDIARLGMAVDTEGLREGQRELHNLVSTGADAEKQIEGQTKRKAASWGRMAAKAGVAIAAVGTGITLAVRGQLNDIDRLAKSAQQIGIPVEHLSQLQHAAELSGVSMEELETGLRRLSQNMVQDADKFEALGIAVRDANGEMRPTVDVMDDLADVMAGMPDGAEKTALAMDLMGRSGAGLIPMFNDGADAIRAMREEADQLGLTISQDTAEAAQAFNDNITRITGAGRGFWRMISSNLAPTLERFSDILVDLVNRFGDMSPRMQSILSNGALMMMVMAPLVAVVGALVGAVALIGAPMLAAGAAIAAVSAILITFWDDIKAAGAAVIQFATDARDGFLEFNDAVVEHVVGAAEWIRTKFEELIQWFTGIPDRMREIGANIAQGLRDGISERWEGVKDSVSGVWSSVTDGARNIFQTRSPSLVFHEIGENISQGLANGITSAGGLAVSAISGIADRVTSGAWDMASGVVDAMGQMFQGSKPIAAAQALINTFQGITEALKLPFPASLAAAARVAAQGFAAVRGIQSARPGGGGGTRGASGGAGGSQSQAAQVATQRVRFEVVGDGPGADAAFRTLQLVQQAIDNGGRLDGLIAERVAG